MIDTARKTVEDAVQEEDGPRQREESQPVDWQECPQRQEHDSGGDTNGTDSPRRSSGSRCRIVAVRSQTALLGDG